jgi:hypothetical protein
MRQAPPLSETEGFGSASTTEGRFNIGSSVYGRSDAAIIRERANALLIRCLSRPPAERKPRPLWKPSGLLGVLRRTSCPGGAIAPPEAAENEFRRLTAVPARGSGPVGVRYFPVRSLGGEVLSTGALSPYPKANLISVFCSRAL